MAKMLRSFLLLSAFCLLAGGAAAQLTANFIATPTSGCSPLVVSFTNTSTGANSYSWNFGNGNTSTLTSPGTTYTAAGTYTVTLTATGANSATATKTISITVYASPTVSFTGTNLTGCPPLSVPFTSTVSANAPGSVTYSWDFGDGSPFSSSANPTHVYTASGPKTVILKVTNGQGCTTTFTQTAYVTVHSKPAANFSASQTFGCSLPLSVTFTSYTSGAAPITLAWTFGNGGSATGNPVSATYTTQGNYTVTLVATDVNGCKDTLKQSNFILAHQNTATFTSPVDICMSDSTLRDTVLWQGCPSRFPFRAGYYGNNQSHVYGPKLYVDTFKNTTSGVAGTQWFFGDGQSDTGKVVTHSYYKPGNDTVLMITMVGPCYDTVKHIVHVHAAPRATITYPYPCPAPASITFTGNTSSGVSNSWHFASGASASGSTASHSYNSNDSVDELTLITTDAWGCSDTIDRAVYIPALHITPRDLDQYHGCIPVTKTFTTALDGVCAGPATSATVWTVNNNCSPACPVIVPITSWLWTFLDNNTTSTSVNPSHTYTVAGSYAVACTAVTTNGCVVSDTTWVMVDTQIHPSFTATPRTACVHSPVTFKSTIPHNWPWLDFYWKFGDGKTDSPDSMMVHKYDTNGVYTVTLVINNHNCYDTVVYPNYITIVGGTARFKDSVYCPPSMMVKFVNQSIGPVTSRVWKFGDGSSDTSFSTTHTYAARGTYNDTLITLSAASGCRDTSIHTLHLRLPALNFVAPDTTICRDDTLILNVSFSDSIAGSAPMPPQLNYKGISFTQASFFLSSSSKVNTIAGTDINTQPWKTFRSFHHRMDTSGTYDVTYVVQDTAYCLDTFSRSMYIIVSRPVPKISVSSQIGCTPFPVVFMDSSAYTPRTQRGSVAWTFGDGTSATTTSQNFTHIYTAPGVYGIKMIATDWNGCADSAFLNVIKARHPKADFTALNTALCEGNPFRITNNSKGATGLTFQWDFGDGTTDTAAVPTKAYWAVGNFSVRLIATDSSGCADTMLKPGYVSITKPHAAFTMSDSLSVCPPLVINFTNASTLATGYNWYFGNGNTSVLQNPVAYYPDTGNYTIRLVVIDAQGCTDTATARARVLGYAGAFSYGPLSGCKPLLVNFSTLVKNVASYTWDFSDGTTLTGTGFTATHVYNTPGTYIPKLIFTAASGCSAASIGIDTIKVDGIIAGFKALPPCERSAILLVDTSVSFFSAKTAWFWRFDNGQTASGASVPHVYPAAGTYPVTLIVTNARGCKDSATNNLVIYPLPVITASPDTTVCPPDAVTISATGGVSYTWSPASSLSCSACTSPAAAPTVATTYIVTGTDEHGCANKDSLRIGMQTKTTFTTKGGGEICLGQHFTLSVQGATLYSWTPAESLDSPLAAHPIATPTATTTYIVTGKEGSCLADTHMVKVVVYPLPTAYAGTDATVVAGKTTLLQASGQNINHLLWSPDSTLSCSGCYAPEAKPHVTTTYVLKTYTDHGCEAADSVRVVVLCDGSQLFIPNTFTPNGDGQNDFFFPRGEGLSVIKSMRVYSRWGEKVFEATGVMLNDERRGWNGSFNGRLMNPDVYVYVIEATCGNGDDINWKGDVTLIR